MKHLSNHQILAAIEHDAGDAASNDHLSSCDACQARVDELRQIVRLMNEVEVPEPSPLFWNHLSQRVREAVAVGPEPRRSWVSGVFGWQAALVAALVVVVIGLVMTRSERPIPTVSTQTEERPVEIALDALSTPNGDATWTFMGELASQMDLEAAGQAGLVASPDSVERALGDLTREEQQLVVELLEQEIQKLKSL
jgi:hypothetical protein